MTSYRKRNITRFPNMDVQALWLKRLSVGQLRSQACQHFTTSCTGTSQPVGTMLSALGKTTRVPPARHSFLALYTTIAGLTRQTWKTNAKPPKPLVQAEEDAEPQFQPPKKSLLKRTPPTESTPRQFAAHRAKMKQSFPEGWSPPRKLSREAMDGLRSLHAHDPKTFSTPVLAQKFKISPEAVRRILKSQWEPSAEKRAKFLEREKKQRTEWIAQRRSEEWERVRELQNARRSEGGQWIRGASKGDKLSLT